LAVGLTVGLGVGIWERNFCLGAFVAYVLGLASWAVAYAAGWAYTRLRFRERARAVSEPSCCPRCGSRRYAGAESRRLFPCPQCGEQAMRVLPVGRS
jgi:hypothetical protein